MAGIGLENGGNYELILVWCPHRRVVRVRRLRVAVLDAWEGRKLTTIAYDGTTLATDSQMSSGNLRFGKVNKIIKLKDGRRFAFAGDHALAYAVADWLNGGTKPERADSEEHQGIIVALDGSVVEVSTELRLAPACVPWAGGSGESIALTAMHCGKTAKEAVEVACKLDKHSGLPVNVFRPKGT